MIKEDQPGFYYKGLVCLTKYFFKLYMYLYSAEHLLTHQASPYRWPLFYTCAVRPSVLRSKNPLQRAKTKHATWGPGGSLNSQDFLEVHFLLLAVSFGMRMAKANRPFQRMCNSPKHQILQSPRLHHSSNLTRSVTNIWQKLEGCISCSQEKGNEKIYNMHSVMTNVNFGRDVATKRERK